MTPHWPSVATPRLPSRRALPAAHVMNVKWIIECCTNTFALFEQTGQDATNTDIIGIRIQLTNTRVLYKSNKCRIHV